MACLICFPLFSNKISFKQTVLELTLEHVLNCLEKLFVAGDPRKNHDKDSCKLHPTTAQRCRLSPTDARCPSNSGKEVHMLYCFLGLIMDWVALTK